MATDEMQNSTGSCQEKELTLLHRFLCYGSENGTYFSLNPSNSTSQQPALESAQCILNLIENGHGEEVVHEICAFAKNNLSVRLEPLVFALAVCAKVSKDLKTKQAALKSLSTVCPSATQLFRFVEYTEKLSGKTTGWGRGQRKAISEWYSRKESGPLSTAVTKYVQRNGWSHLDLIRLAHIKPERDVTAVCLKYVVKGLEATKKQYGSDCPSAEVTSVLAYLQAVDTVKHSTDAHAVARLIEQFQLSREHIPTTLVNSKEVWSALLQHISLLELLSYLAKMTAVGLLTAGDKHSQVPLITDKLKNDTLIKESMIHPFHALLALKTYELGKVEKGKLKWIPNSSVIEALHVMFQSSFKNVEATNKRYLIGVNVHSLSKGPVVGSSILPPILTASAMAMTIARSEQQHQLVVCTDSVTSVNITSEMSLNEVTQAISQVPGERTKDNSMPIRWATKKKKVPTATLR